VNSPRLICRGFPLAADADDLAPPSFSLELPVEMEACEPIPSARMAFMETGLDRLRVSANADPHADPGDGSDVMLPSLKAGSG
jgi:hypothetical protein